jgi:hypothetical protein
VKERDVNFFRPLWRRIAVTAVCVVWAALELWHGEQMWIWITLGLSAYAVWNFFIAFPKNVPASTPAIEGKGGPDVPPQA